MTTPEADPPSHTVDEYCKLEKTSRAQLYREWQAGKGPRYYFNGNRRRISEEARREYRRQKEAEAACVRAEAHHASAA
jgi:sarcosine oxidase delta subunit